ncbi:hypothetical protein E3J62_02830 [candidate division TA06 bacterium]|uniref:Uncharacterized protein n=1 Tax=candidate division TA06 bacterium TaxID=2250710 RepID=A0A523UWH7_UNCT6|nr:MAG: hypothetical protein E3J62_02830 [candidate division TA06 bacterium]
MKKLGYIALGILLVIGLSGAAALAKGKGFVHGIVVKLDGEDYYLAGPPDGPNGASDIPGHWWRMAGMNRMVGKHYNTGPFGASSWWATQEDDGILLFNVRAIIDTWSMDKAKDYSEKGYVHYHEFVRVSDGAQHPSKVVWLHHRPMLTFYFDGGPHPELAHQVYQGRTDYDFIPNWNMPYSP